MPIKIEFIESLEKVDELLPKLLEMAGTGLVEVQDTAVVNPSETSKKGSPQVSTPALRREGKAKLVQIFVGENDKWQDKSLYRAIVESMRANDIAGVTVHQGILGYGANRRIRKDSALHLSHDRPIEIDGILPGLVQRKRDCMTADSRNNLRMARQGPSVPPLKCIATLMKDVANCCPCRLTSPLAGCCRRCR